MYKNPQSHSNEAAVMTSTAHARLRIASTLTHAFRALLIAPFLIQPVVSIAQDSESATVRFAAPDGSVHVLAASADDDGDGIENALEVNGFTYHAVDGIQPWNGDPTVRHFKTNPQRWSTDEDPYSDFTEASGVNLPPNIEAPFNHPLVAARPVISVYMDSYDVVPVAEITDTRGRSITASYTNETTNEDQLGGSITGTAKLNPLEMASVAVEVSYSHTWVNTESTTRDTTVDVSKATTTSPQEAAKLKLRVYYQNRGSAAARNVRPTINLLLGGKVITTYQANEGEETADFLAPVGQPESRYPRATGDADVIVIGDAVGQDEIILTLDELKALEAGTPLSLVVTQVQADVPRWNASSNTWECPGQCRWADFEGFMNPVSVAIQADLGTEKHEYYVFAGTPSYDPQHALRDVLSLVFEIEDRDGTTYINGRRYPDDWYLSTPSDVLVDEWEDAGRPQNMLDLRMHRRTRLVMASPGPDSGPIIDAATYSPDLKYPIVSARQSGGFPILSATATLYFGDVTREVPLHRSSGSAFYTSSVALDVLPSPGSYVTLEDTRGDTRVATLRLPALAESCEELKAVLGLLPDPGGEFTLYFGDDWARQAKAHCRFYDGAGTLLDTPVTSFWFPETAEPGDYYSLTYATDLIGVAAGQGGVLMRTDDGGASWTRIFTGFDWIFNDVAFADENRGLAVGAYRTIYETDDGGLTWSLVRDENCCKLTAVDFMDASTAVAVGEDLGAILLSTDGGASWSARPSPTSKLRDVTFVEGGVGIIVGSDGVILRSTDGGLTWPEVPSGTTAWLNKVDFANDDLGLIVGSTILRTTDGGLSWTTIFNSVPGFLNSVVFVDDTTAFAVGGQGTILRSTDAGLSWSPQISRTGVQLYDIAMAGDQTLQVIGQQGSLLHSPSRGGVPIPVALGGGSPVAAEPAEPADEIPVAFALAQNYPNPFNPTTTIEYHVAEPQTLSLRVYDVLGREVAVLVDEVKAPGNYSVRFDARGLASGLYLYRLSAGAHVFTKMMTVLK